MVLHIPAPDPDRLGDIFVGKGRDIEAGCLSAINKTIYG